MAAKRQGGLVPVPIGHQRPHAPLSASAPHVAVGRGASQRLVAPPDLAFFAQRPLTPASHVSPSLTILHRRSTLHRRACCSCTLKLRTIFVIFPCLSLMLTV